LWANKRIRRYQSANKFFQFHSLTRKEKKKARGPINGIKRSVNIIWISESKKAGREGTDRFLGRRFKEY